MDDRRWERIEVIFEQAAALAPGERAAFLDSACGDDTGLREEVESLLASDPLAESFMNRLDADHVAPALGDALAGRDPLLGARLGPFRVEQRIGRGGMGTVYRASRDDGAYDQDVALKVVRHDLSEQMTARFLSERRILARLAHPGIARILDGGVSDDGRPWLAMELVDGEPVTAYADRERLSVNERLALFRSICAAVAYAHQNLVVHRDLKPSNILVTPAGEVKLVDFGIARLLDDGDGVAHTQTGGGPMTPEYAAPEQVRGESITVATDVYALGVLLYELLTGRRPYRIPSRVRHEVERAILEEEPTRPSTAVEQPMPAAASGAADTSPEAVSQMRRADPHTLRRRLSGDLDVIILKALRKTPAERYASAQSLADDVEAHLTGRPVTARPPSARYRAGRFVRRHRWGVAAVSTVILLLLAYAGTITYQAGVISAERDRAGAEARKAEAVADFLVGLFVANRPDVALGETPSARDLLDRGASRAADLTDQPEVRAELLAVIGRAYVQLGMLDTADSLLTMALEAHLALYGEERTATAHVLNNLANLHFERGDLEQAIALMLRSADAHVAAGSPPNVAAVPLANVAALERMRGNLPAAAVQFERALELYRASGATDESNYYGILTGAGLTYRQLERFEDAEAAYTEALAGLRETAGPNHPEVATVLNNLGMLYLTRDDAAAAQPLIEEAYEIRRLVLGESHAHTVQLMSNRGQVALASGAIDRAIELFTAALRADEEGLGPDHPTVGIHVKLLGDAHLEAGDAPLAMRHYERAARIFEAAFPEGHDRTAGARLAMSEALAAVGRLDEAEALARQGLAAYAARHTDEGIATARARRQLGAILVAQGRYDEAAEHLLASRAVLETRQGPAHRDTRRAYGALEALYAAMGDDASRAEFIALLGDTP